MRLFPLTTEHEPERAAAVPTEPMDFDAGNERLRAAHLHNGQVEARALFAPFFAVTAVVAALIVGWAMYGAVEHQAGRRLGLAGRLRQLGLVPPCDGRRRPRRQPHRPAARAWFAVVEAVGLAGLWSALPTWAFATQPPSVQVVIGGAMAAMISTAIALAAIPRRRSPGSRP